MADFLGCVLVASTFYLAWGDEAVLDITWWITAYREREQ